jgi:transposase
MVKKLLQQRRHTGEIGPCYHRCGRKPRILESHREQLRVLLKQKPDMTLKEMRERIALDCTLPAIHYVLEDMGLTYKKRLFTQSSKSAKMWSRPGHFGVAARVA